MSCLGLALCMLASHRAEQSRTVHHRAEYQLFEAELPFNCFDIVFNNTEDLV